MSKPEFVYVTYIETTPEKLWEALTDSEFSKRYWFGTEVEVGLEGRFALCAGRPTARPPIPAKFSKPIARGGCPTRSSMSCTRPCARNAATKVVFTLEPYRQAREADRDP